MPLSNFSKYEIKWTFCMINIDLTDFLCLCLLFFYEEETPSTITMGFVSSQIPLLIVCKKTCSIWLWDNNPCNRNKGRLWNYHWRVKAMYFFRCFISFFLNKQNNYLSVQECHYCWYAFTTDSSQIWFRISFYFPNLSQLLIRQRVCRL